MQPSVYTQPNKLILKFHSFLFLAEVELNNIRHNFMVDLGKNTQIRTLSLDIFGGGQIYLDSDMEKPGRSVHFPEGT